MGTRRNQETKGSAATVPAQATSQHNGVAVTAQSASGGPDSPTSLSPADGPASGDGKPQWAYANGLFTLIAMIFDRFFTHSATLPYPVQDQLKAFRSARRAGVAVVALLCLTLVILIFFAVAGAAVVAKYGSPTSTAVFGGGTAVAVGTAVVKKVSRSSAKKKDKGDAGEGD